MASRLFALFALLWSFNSPAGAAKNDPLPADFDEQVYALMESAGVPGLSLGVIRDGKVIKVSQYGFANTKNQEKLTSDHFFQAASLSKPVFAYIVMRLVDKGAIALDKPLYELLENNRFDNEVYAEALTARLTLSHQPGLPNWGGTPLKFLYAPGYRFSYSGEGYLYTQQALSALTGLTIQELAKREVFEPLGMKKSRFNHEYSDELLTAKPHSAAGKVEKARIPVNNAASSLYSEASEYTRFMQAILTGEGLTPKTYKAMLKKQVATPEAPDWDNKGIPLSKTLGWALGWGRQETADGITLWHWGNNGSYRSFVALDPKAKNGMVYFANTSTGHAILNGLYRLVGMDVSALSKWIEEKQSDTPGYQLWRKGVIAEAEKDYEATLRYYKAAMDADPINNSSLKNVVTWYDTFLEMVKADLQPISQEEAAPYIGQYGPRKIWLEGSKLMYQRGTGGKFALKPAGANRFLLTGFTGFSLEFDIGEDGLAAVVRGRYVDNGTDEFKRGETAQN